jgi:polyphosphate kinase
MIAGPDPGRTFMDAPREPAVAERRDYSQRRPRPRKASKPVLRVIPPPDLDPADLKNPALYINRELSWLEFNQRVLDQALDASHPLLERVKFLAIAATNLDEFFMIRISTTQKNLREGIEDVAPDGYNTQQQLEAMRAQALRMLQDVAACWEQLRPLLAAENITLLDQDGWTPQIREHLNAYFSREICPVLTPLAFDPGHPFPLISNLSKNFAVVVRHGGRTKFARVKVPDVLPRFIAIPESLTQTKGDTFVCLEDVIRANIHELFPGTR